MISNEYAEEIVANLRAVTEGSDELTGGEPPNPRDLLLLKLWDELQAVKAGTAFLGVGGGIKPVTKIAG